MFDKFRSSNLNSVIASFEELRKATKKCAQLQKKAFYELQNWSIDSNNSAIQDVSCKLASLNSGTEDSLKNDKIDALEKIVEMFNRFKEFDSKLNDLTQKQKNATKYEKKCLNEIKKCPASKNIRDCEVKHMKAKHDSEISQLKYEEFSEEINATKTILFKKNLKRFSDSLRRFNDSERILLEAMQNLVEKIPDVSNEEVDDINLINYTKSAETEKICHEAKQRLQVVSSSRLKTVESSNRSEEMQLDRALNFKGNEELKKTPTAKPLPKLSAAIKTRMSCPGQFEIRSTKRNELYPCLESLVPTEFAPPPTYSDSESLHRGDTVLPSAPSLNQIQSRKHAIIFPPPPANSALSRSERSPTFEKSKQ